MTRTKPNAFTLLEVLMVLALLGVLAAIVWPDFAAAGRSDELRESAQRVKSALHMARARAMSESRIYRVTIRTDGRLRIRRQFDPLLAPHRFYRFKDEWANMQLLLEHVWIESAIPLPEGPPPILIEDDLIEFDQDEFEAELIPVEDLESNLTLAFYPDGLCSSARWMLRDEDGRGLRMTLDGRLGRVTIEVAARADADSLERPDPLDETDEELEFEENQELPETREEAS